MWALPTGYALHAQQGSVYLWLHVDMPPYLGSDACTLLMSPKMARGFSKPVVTSANAYSPGWRWTPGHAKFRVSTNHGMRREFRPSYITRPLQEVSPIHL